MILRDISDRVRKDLHQYKINKIIGSGAFGEVFGAVELSSGTPVAIKRVGNLFDDLTVARRNLREVRCESVLSLLYCAFVDFVSVFCLGCCDR
jgi:serine/threonine protein kinase